MARRREQLALRTIVVTFVAALHTISRMDLDRDMRMLLAEGARDRALEFLTAFERKVPYEPGSYLDEAVRDARRRIERATIEDR